MSDEIEASVVRGPDGCVVQLFVRDPQLAGRKGSLKIEQNAKVKRSSPVHKSVVLAEEAFTLQPGQNLLRLGKVLDAVFAYSGAKLDLELKARIEIDDGVIFDTKLELDLTPHCLLPQRSAVPDHKGVHSPRDRFSFIANLRAIPAKARMTVLWLIFVGGPVVLINGLVGARYQFVPESQVWFYDHTGDDGSESPLMKALMGSGAAGFALWMAIRAQLQKYMRFGARLPGSRVRRGERCKVAEMIEGEARVPLQQTTVRVVAYNQEHGQYRTTEGSGKNKKTVTKSFSDAGRGVVLYEQLLAYVPANVPLRDYLEGEVDFTPVFDALYPPTMIGGTHGLSLKLEAQLLHPDFVDHEVEMDPGQVEVREFYGPVAAS